MLRGVVTCEGDGDIGGGFGVENNVECGGGPVFFGEQMGAGLLNGDARFIKDSYLANIPLGLY